MKLLKKEGRRVILYHETDENRELLEKYLKSGYEIVNVKPCSTCGGTGWEEDEHTK